MSKKYIIKTDRLGLRNWKSTDIDEMVLLNQDAEVMEYFPSIQSKEQTVNFVKRMQSHFVEFGFCYFAVEVLETSEFIGFIGLIHQNYKSDFTPCVDIGWRLKKEAWGKGYATEGAKACLDFAFKELQLQEVLSTAPLMNLKSQKVMEKIGMQRVKVFEHSKLLNHEHLKKCVLYKKSRKKMSEK